MYFFILTRFYICKFILLDIFLRHKCVCLPASTHTTHTTTGVFLCVYTHRYRVAHFYYLVLTCSIQPVRKYSISRHVSTSFRVQHMNVGVPRQRNTFLIHLIGSNIGHNFSIPCLSLHFVDFLNQ